MNSLQILGFSIDLSIQQLDLNQKKLMVNTINPHSYCVTKGDGLYKESLQQSDILIPDGVGIVWAAKLLHDQKINRITGADLHEHLLQILNQTKGKVFYMGSMPETLQKIEKRLNQDYPCIQFAGYSPPYIPVFSDVDNKGMINAINDFQPHVVFVGMTAPKQEKWAYQHKHEIDTNIIASIGAVFDFYAGNVKRAPLWIQKIGMEWLHRSIMNPKRLGMRNLKSNPEFIWDVIKYKFNLKK